MDIKPIDIAVREAHKSPHKFRHGACVVNRRGKIIGWGYNYYLHAEVLALLSVPRNQRQGAEVWSVRISDAGTKLSTAKPCPACQKFMKRYGVRRVYYTDRTEHVNEITL